MSTRRNSFSSFHCERSQTCHQPTNMNLKNLNATDRRITAVNAHDFPVIIEGEKIQITKKWKITVQREEGYYNLDKCGIRESVFDKYFLKDNLTNPEIHVFWVPHVPLETFRDVNITVSCDFTATTDDARRTLGATVFPVGLTSHSIFRPGHSIKIGHGEQIPWAVGTSLSESVFTEGYTIAELYISLIGYKTLIGNVDTNKETSLISLVPMEENFSGVSFSRPRVFGDKWIMKNYKLALKSNNDVQKIMRLQELGFDTEALIHMGAMKSVLRKISLSHLKDRDSPDYLGAMKMITSIVASKISSMK